MAGRKTKYDDGLHKDWAKSLAMEGLIDKEIAKRMNIARSTLNKWKIEHPEFSDSIKIGKEPANAKVEMSLFKRANGYTIKLKKIIVEMDKDGNQKPSRIETTEHHIQPDVGAQCFFLKNRLPELWRDVKNLDIQINQFEELMMKASVSSNKIIDIIKDKNS